MRYKVTATIDGKRKYFYGASKEQAKQKRAEFLEQNTRKSHSFGYVAELWWEEKQEEIAFNTTKGYKPAMERAVKEYGDMDITLIKPSDVAVFIRQFARGDRADKTVRTQLLVINSIFKYAINILGIEMQNPARDIEIPKRLRKTKVSCPSDNEIEIIMGAEDCLFKRMAMFFIFTGIRKGELLALTYEDIGKSTIKVNKSIYHDNNVPKVKEPKTEAGVRYVPIIKALEPYIEKGKGIVFSENGKYMRDSFFQKGWNRWCRSLGIHVTPHQLRHLYASMLWEHGVDPKLAGRILGHAQISTTMDIYAEIRKEKEKYSSLYWMDINPRAVVDRS